MYALNSWSFALFSANIHRYLPQFSWEEHQILYHKWMDYHRERSLSHQLRHKQIDEGVVHACRCPSIITIFHLGDHLVWPILLAQNGIRFNVILDRNVYQDAKKVFDRLLNQLSTYGYTPELLFSDDPGLLLKIRSRKAKGQHLLCFADGSSGSSIPTKDERVSIPFMAGEIRLKKGIPFMSHLFAMPILSLLPVTKAGMQYLKIDRIIAPSTGEKRDTYVPRCLREIYLGLEQIVRTAPFTWECWGYLHRNGMIGKILDIQIVGDGYALIQLPWNNKKIWFDRVNYTAHV